MTNVSFQSVNGLGIAIDSLVFGEGASLYTVSIASSATFALRGMGIVNDSGSPQHFVVRPDGINGSTFQITNSATAGEGTFFEVDSSVLQLLGDARAGSGTFVGNAFAQMEIRSNASADRGTFICNGATENGFSFGGTVSFMGNATAALGTFTIFGGAASGSTEGQCYFYDTASAASAVMTAKGGSVNGADGRFVWFVGDSDGGDATLIATGGVEGAGGAFIRFDETSSGNSARVEIFDSGHLEIGAHAAPGVSIGSLEGTGDVFLGARVLSVGENNLNTTYDGVLQDGGVSGGSGGSVTKVGAGTLTLSGVNTASLRER
ncbi:MAG: hypothetical protein H0X34_14555 [Chthoniobacterales bacterium]|nr:hypothetical protein [Chthoniobacterales bacterium]